MVSTEEVHLSKARFLANLPNEVASYDQHCAVRAWSRTMLGALIQTQQVLALSKKMPDAAADRFLNKYALAMRQVTQQASSVLRYLPGLSVEGSVNQTVVSDIQSFWSKILSLDAQTQHDLVDARERLNKGLSLLTKQLCSIARKIDADGFREGSEHYLIAHHPAEHTIARKALIRELRALSQSLVIDRNNVIPQNGFLSSYTTGEWVERLKREDAELFAIYAKNVAGEYELKGFSLSFRDTASLEAPVTQVIDRFARKNSMFWLDCVGIAPEHRKIEGQHTYSLITQAQTDLARFHNCTSIALHVRAGSQANTAEHSHRRQGFGSLALPDIFYPDAPTTPYRLLGMPVKHLEKLDEGHINGARLRLDENQVLDQVARLSRIAEFASLNPELLHHVIMYQDIGRHVQGLIEIALERKDKSCIPYFGPNTQTLVDKIIDESDNYVGTEKVLYLNNKHPDLSKALLLDLGILDYLSSQDRADVLQAVLFHNARVIPDDGTLTETAQKLCKAAQLSGRFSLIQRSATHFCTASLDQPGNLVAQWGEYLASEKMPRMEYYSSPYRIAVEYVQALQHGGRNLEELCEKNGWLEEFHNSLTGAIPDFLLERFEQGGTADRKAMTLAGSYQGFLTYMMCMFSTLPPVMQRELFLEQQIDKKYIEGLRSLGCSGKQLARIGYRWQCLREKCEEYGNESK